MKSNQVYDPTEYNKGSLNPVDEESDQNIALLQNGGLNQLDDCMYAEKNPTMGGHIVVMIKRRFR